MKIIIDTLKDSLVVNIHLNIDGTCFKICDLSSVSSVSIVQKEGEVFIDSVSKEEVSISDVEVVESSVVEKTEPVLNESLKRNSGLDESPKSDLVIENIELSIDEVLFQRLAELRRNIAKESKIPPYYIFHDKSLKEMANYLPCDFEEMRKIIGVGEAKLEKYGSLFIEVIKKYLEENS